MWEFQLGGIEDLERLGGWLGVRIEAIEDVSILAKPVQVGGLVIPNSLAYILWKAATAIRRVGRANSR